MMFLALAVCVAAVFFVAADVCATLDGFDADLYDF
jgi:hypothetical protein